MTSMESWQNLITYLNSNPHDFSTVPKINREKLWFFAETDGKYIFIKNAQRQRPSCQLSTTRRITYTDFDVVYSYYQRWASGEVGVRDEVRKKSRNTAYIFGLITFLREG